MDPRPVPQRPLLPQIPVAARRVAGVTLLTLTLWRASVLALIR